MFDDVQSDRATTPGDGTTSDGATDVTPAADADASTSGCNDDDCDQSCQTSGSILGFCRNNMCMCRGSSADGGPTSFDVMIGDVPPPDSGTISCTTNAQCPSYAFCNGPACTGTGFCSPRMLPDAGACGSSGTPSCGCDGRVYANTCARQAAGVRPASTSTCGGTDAGGTDAPADVSSGG